MNDIAKVYAATPSGVDIHHDVLLSNVAVAAFAGPEEGMVADELVPGVGVSKESDRYAILDQNAFLRDEGESAGRDEGLRRARKTEAKRLEFKVSSDAYFADGYAAAAEIALEDLANADAVFNVRQNHVNLITGALRRDREIRTANLLTSASNLGSGTTLAGNSQWSDYVNSDPLGDVNTAHAFIRGQSGLIANTMLMDYDTWKIVRRHPDLLEMFKNTDGMLTGNQLREAFDVDRIVIARGIKETGDEDENETVNISNIWGNNVLLMHHQAAASQQTKTLALRFQWTPAGFPAPFSVNTRRESGAGTRNVEIIETSMFEDLKIIAPNLGYLISSTI